MMNNLFTTETEYPKYFSAEVHKVLTEIQIHARHTDTKDLHLIGNAMVIVELRQIREQLEGIRTMIKNDIFPPL